MRLARVVVVHGIILIPVVQILNACCTSSLLNSCCVQWNTCCELKATETKY
ncbi:hypothetical protein PR003_g21734 [Phytophthora rubi]|uniref:Uncharacterized protein n=1 Tax=Phytophthora rubi TaxID=129364 RepID=A0A6A4D9S2_9STRA|nr:hypothetical protein PR002_g21145 [Phytophthora rubi]KAE8993543.1 hypothetical protein PR001_g20640 [Phytophthora rubi]KAE9304529.1 hypothetical protein PR003_g21734 [Phytophthora rubi]